MTREGKSSELKKKKIPDLNPSNKKKASHIKSKSLANKDNKNYHKLDNKERNAVFNLEKNSFQTERNNSAEDSRRKQNFSTSYKKIKSERLNKSKENEKSNNKSTSFFCSEDQIIRLFNPHQLFFDKNNKSKLIEGHGPQKNNIPLKDENIHKNNFHINTCEKPDANTFSFGYTHSYLNNFKSEENYLKGRRFEEVKDEMLGNELVSPRISDFQQNEGKEENSENFRRLFLKNNLFINQNLECDEEHDFGKEKGKKNYPLSHYANKKKTNEDKNENLEEVGREEVQESNQNFKNLDENLESDELNEIIQIDSNINLNTQEKKSRFIKLRNNLLNVRKTEELGDPSYADLHRKRTQSYSNAAYLKKM